LIGFFVTTVVHPPVMASPDLVAQMESDRDSNGAWSVAASASLGNLLPEMLCTISKYLNSDDTGSLRLVNLNARDSIARNIVQKKRENEQKRIKEFIEKTGLTDLNDKKFSEAIKTIRALSLKDFPYGKQVEAIRAIYALDSALFKELMAKTSLKNFPREQRLEAMGVIQKLNPEVFKEFMTKTSLDYFPREQRLEAMGVIQKLNPEVFKKIMTKTSLDYFLPEQQLEAMVVIHELDPEVFEQFIANNSLKEHLQYSCQRLIWEMSMSRNNLSS